MMKFLSRWQTENMASFDPKKEAVDDFIAHKDAFMAGSVWATGCRSWYKANTVDGKVAALWPGSTLHYMEACQDVRYDDWNIAYTGNRFAWLGNGYSQVELDPTADKAYYIRNEDDSPFLGKARAREVMSFSGSLDPDDPKNVTGPGI